MSFAWKLAQVSEGRRGGTGARQQYARLGTNHGRVEWRERRLRGTPLFFFSHLHAAHLASAGSAACSAPNCPNPVDQRKYHDVISTQPDDRLCG
ncbi:uncharacterized [Tachysurus ichikawai]